MTTRLLQRQIMPLDRDNDVFSLYVDPEPADCGLPLCWLPPPWLCWLPPSFLWLIEPARRASSDVNSWALPEA